jgi:hypothetical protein
VSGQAVCLACDAGSYATFNGSIECQSCDEGKFSSKSAHKCANCTGGSHADSTGRAACLTCESGTVSEWLTGSISCIETFAFLMSHGP